MQRSACPDQQVQTRRARQLEPSQLRGETLCIDGFNVLTTLEVALSGGVLLIGRDGVMRDIAGVHGSYRSVEETTPALQLLADLTLDWGLAACEFYLDQPVSNSGRLRAHLLEVAQLRTLPWSAHVVMNPDRELIRSPHVVASADAQILDAGVRWTNLARNAVALAVASATVVDLSACESGEPA